MSMITVLAGDIPEGQYQLKEYSIIRKRTESFVFTKQPEYELRKQIETLDIMTEESKKKFISKFGWGFLGLISLGPLGALSGLLAGGNKKELCFVCALKSGEKFLGKTDGKTFEKMMALSFKT